MSDLAAALQVAIRVHAAQTDKQGEPYLLHILRVVEAVSDEAKVVAALHDVLGDGGREAWGIVPRCRLSTAEETTLVRLTRQPQMDYMDYIKRIAARDMPRKARRLAREVKLADLKDNLSRIPERTGSLPQLAEHGRTWDPLRRRYEQAIATLEATG